MANETTICVVGNLTAAPELRYTQNGLPVVNFTIASTPRTLDRATNEWKDGEALFLRCSAWREFAEHIAASLDKGTRVIAQGNLKQRSYETKPTDGSAPEKRTSVELEVQAIGPELTFATAQVTRATRAAGGVQQAPGGYGQQTPQMPQGYGQPPQQQPFQGQPQQGWAQPQQQPDAWSAPGAYGDDTPF